MYNNEKIIVELNNKKIFTGKWVCKTYPLFYSDILKWSEHIENLPFSERYYLYISKLNEKPVCKNCGSSKLGFINKFSGYNKYCSTKCTANSKETELLRKKKCIEKYGVEHPMKSSDIKEKFNDKIKDKYGVDNISQLDSIKKKKTETMIDNFGVEYNFQRNDVKKVLSNNATANNKKRSLEKEMEYVSYTSTKLEPYGITVKSYRNMLYNCICSDNHEFTISKNMINDRIKLNVDICTVCKPIGIPTSSGENELYEYINSLVDIDIIKNHRIDGLELDIYLPTLNIAFEYNGLFWHSDYFKNPNYHLEKTRMCERKGIKLTHIWEDEWKNKCDIIKSMIKSRLGLIGTRIYARKCEILEIDNSVYRKFLSENHLQGNVNAKFKYGLYYNNEIVSVMSFGNLRKNMGFSKKDGIYELLRYCNKLNTHVVGGASKLLSHFIKNVYVDDVITYANRDYSDGNLYEKIGMIYDGETKPNFFYVKGDVRFNRFTFRKSVLVEEGYDSNKSASEIMHERGYHKLYTTGSFRYKLKKG